MQAWNSELPRRHFAVEEAVADELLVYLPGAQRCILLNPTAAAVYHACDGQTSFEQVAGQLGSPELVAKGLELLSKEGLVPDHGLKGLSRREMLSTLGKAAMLPVVTSVLVPSPLAAASGCVQEADATSTCEAVGVPTGPTGCPTCCSAGIGNCATACPDCTVCTCMRRRDCAGGDCTLGTCSGDTQGTQILCLEDGTNPLCDFGGFNICQRNCNNARAAAGSAGRNRYFCCQSCT